MILTAIVERYSTDRQGPGIEENEGLRHERDREERAEILKYDVTTR
jgi:hypothetical protein